MDPSELEHGQARIDVRIPARAELIPTVRLLTADLAGRADFDLDAIADLQMAVDEAANALLRQSDPTRPLRFAFLVNSERIQITAEVAPRSTTARVNVHGFGWRVLNSLVDQLDTHSRGEQSEERLVIEMAKKGIGR